MFSHYSQEQYIFLHNALLEYLTCGNTRVSASQLEQELVQLTQPRSLSGHSELEEQFVMLCKISPLPNHTHCSVALHNPMMNRNTDYLPSESGECGK